MNERSAHSSGVRARHRPNANRPGTAPPQPRPPTARPDEGGGGHRYVRPKGRAAGRGQPPGGQGGRSPAGNHASAMRAVPTTAAAQRSESVRGRRRGGGGFFFGRQDRVMNVRLCKSNRLRINVPSPTIPAPVGCSYHVWVCVLSPSIQTVAGCGRPRPPKHFGAVVLGWPVGTGSGRRETYLLRRPPSLPSSDHVTHPPSCATDPRRRHVDSSSRPTKRNSRDRPAMKPASGCVPHSWEIRRARERPELDFHSCRRPPAGNLPGCRTCAPARS